jgi:ribosomal protein S18 acetylase RimI-like enzyme
MEEDTHCRMVHKSIMVRNALPYDAKGATKCIELASCSSIHECWPDTIARLIRQSQMASSGVTCVVATTIVATNKEQSQQVVIVVGFLAFKRINHLSYLYVRPSFQRQEVGRALWEHAVNQMPAGTTIITVNSSLAAIPFYERLGFQQEAQFENNCTVFYRFVPMFYVLEQY